MFKKRGSEDFSKRYLANISKKYDLKPCFCSILKICNVQLDSALTKDVETYSASKKFRLTHCFEFFFE